MENKFGKQFEKLKESGLFKLYGEQILVERIPNPERKTRTGIVLAPMPETHRDIIQAENPVFCRVIYVGEGFYDDETREPIPLDINVDDIVFVSPMSVVWYKSFGNLVSTGDQVIGRIAESAILGRFKGGEAGFEEALKILAEYV